MLILSSCSRPIGSDEPTAVTADTYITEADSSDTDEISHYRKIFYDRCVNVLNSLVSGDTENLAQITENNVQDLNFIKDITFSGYNIIEAIDNINEYKKYMGIKCIAEISVEESEYPCFPVGRNKYIIESIMSDGNGFKVLCLSKDEEKYNTDITSLYRDEKQFEGVNDINAVLFCKYYSIYVREIDGSNETIDKRAEAYAEFLLSSKLADSLDADELNSALYDALGILFDFKDSSFFNSEANDINYNGTCEKIKYKAILRSENEEDENYIVVIDWYNDSLCLSPKYQITYYLSKKQNQYHLEKYEVSVNFY